MHGELKEWGGAGPVIHLAHANGFPPGTYGQLIRNLKGHGRVVSWTSLPLREGTSPEAVSSWNDLAVDLRAGLDRSGLSGLVGVGHSIGAVVSVMAAAEDPKLFRGLVLVDPVLFAGWRSLAWSLTRMVGQAHRFYLARGARKRRDQWPSRNVVLRAWRGRAPFSAWAPGVLEDYVESGFVDGPTGVKLAYPKEWEARLFECTPPSVWSTVRRVEVPVVVLRGEASDTFLPSACRRLKRELPRARIVEVPGTSHFVPMENPDVVAEEVVGLLRKLG